MLVKLVVMNGSSQGKSFLVGDGGALSFGRSGGNQVVILDRHMSRKHFEVRVEKGRALIRDLGSANGTRVNDEPITETLLRQDDNIEAGEHLFAVEVVADDPSESETVAMRCEKCGVLVQPWEVEHAGAVCENGRAYCPGCVPGATLVLQKRLLGPFRLETILGKGGMGSVYLAYDTRNDTLVALKVLQSSQRHNEEAVQRFLREAQTAGKLNHENIVAIIDVGSVRETHYIAMEYIDGQSVGDLLKLSSRLDWHRAADITRQMARALTHAHERHMVHRDIKPDNILLTRNGVAKLTDFGLARCLEESGMNRMTRSNVGLGTPHYMPPEQIYDARGADIRCDIYALGATLFHMLTGRTPFMAEKMHQLVSSIRDKNPPELTTIGVAGPSWLQELLDIMMAKNPEDRFQEPQMLLTYLDTRLGTVYEGLSADMVKAEARRRQQHGE